MRKVTPGWGRGLHSGEHWASRMDSILSSMKMDNIHVR